MEAGLTDSNTSYFSKSYFDGSISACEESGRHSRVRSIAALALAALGDMIVSELFCSILSPKRKAFG